MHFPFTPNHVQLVSACYPPNAALLNAGPEYRPNAQELSRMTYYASNKPGKITKLSGELEKRVRIDCKKAQANNLRARSSLLISLAMFKALAAECRRDIALLSSSLLASVNVTLSTLPSDLEVVARSASVFTAWTTYTDGHLIGVDRMVTEHYMSCLQTFSRMGQIAAPKMDTEMRNRTRLLGLVTLLGVVTSQALFYSSTQLTAQIDTLSPALLSPLFSVDVSTLEEESTQLKEVPNSPYGGGIRDRPTIEQRAASIHAHVDGDKGPSSGDVANTALHGLSTLLDRCNANQAAVVMRAAFNCLDDLNKWDKVSHCEWIAVKIAEWTQYQYRYAIPTRLVEHLVEIQDAPHSSARHIALAAMVKTVFTSPTPLINLSTSDIISSLISIILKRVLIDTQDPLLPALVECIASLGAHVYYADQIHDLAGELISRLVIVETNGLSNGKGRNDSARTQAIRYLLEGLLGLMRAADLHDAKEGIIDEPKPQRSGTGTTLPGPSSLDGHIKPSRRTKISPEVWQDTLTLLCDADCSIRMDYAEAVISYLKDEIPKLGDYTDADGVRRIRPLDGPVRQASTLTSVMYGDSTTRFLNALHAHLYILATSPVLGFNSDSPSSSVVQRAEGEQNGANHETLPRTSDIPQIREPDSRDHSKRSTTVPPRTRKTSVMIKALQNPSSSTSISAELSDYHSVFSVMAVVQECLPVRGLLTGVPMLLAWEESICSKTDDPDNPPSSARAKAMRELLIRTWLAVGKVWNSSIREAAEKALAPIGHPLLASVERSTPASGAILHPRMPLKFADATHTPSEFDSFDSQSFVKALATSEAIQSATGLDSEVLLKRLTAPWTPEGALRESTEVQTSYDALRQDSIAPLIKVAPTLMHIDNMSLQSLARSTRGVGVTDLREALEGRNSMSNPNLLNNRAPSLSTLEHTTTLSHGHSEQYARLTPVRSRPQQRSKLAGPGEVRDVLNKLGIGKQNGMNLLKSSFPALQKPQQSSPVVVPPYRT